MTRTNNALASSPGMSRTQYASLSSVPTANVTSNRRNDVETVETPAWTGATGMGTTMRTGQRGTRRNDSGDGTASTAKQWWSWVHLQTPVQGEEMKSLMDAPEKARKKQDPWYYDRVTVRVEKVCLIIRDDCSDYLNLSQGEQFVPTSYTTTSDCTTDVRHVGFGSPRRVPAEADILLRSLPFIRSSIWSYRFPQPAMPRMRTLSQAAFRGNLARLRPTSAFKQCIIADVIASQVFWSSKLAIIQWVNSGLMMICFYWTVSLAAGRWVETLWPGILLSRIN